MDDKDDDDDDDVEKGLVLLEGVENRHKDLLLVRDKILKVYETWSNLNKFAFEIQTTHCQIIDDLKISLNYLSQANNDTKESFEEMRKNRNYFVLLSISVCFISALALILFILVITLK